MDPNDQQALIKLLNDHPDGWVKAMGLRYVVASADEVAVEWTVAEQHLQPYGIVHGGVHCGVIETLCSIGASIAARSRGQTGGVVGLENNTSFIRAVRAGVVLRGRAVPVTRGRTTQLWSAQITDPEGRLVAQGSVRLLCLTEGQIPSPTGS
ncbi:MAG: PaaI family thioesterase [Polyangiales bacterium]